VSDATQNNTGSYWQQDEVEIVLSPNGNNVAVNNQSVKYAIPFGCTGAVALAWSASGFTTDWTTDASISCSSAYSGGVYTVEFCANLQSADTTYGFNPAVNDPANIQMMISEGGAYKQAYAFGSTINSPLQWGKTQFSSATPPAPPADTTPPTYTSTAEANITQTTADLLVNTVADDRSANIRVEFYWGTSTGNYNLTTSPTPFNTVATGNSTSYRVTGLSCGTTYYWQVKLIDATSNTTTTTEDSFSTTTCTTYYISPSSNDTTGDSSVGNPWKTFSKVKTAMASSARDIILENGTYTQSTTGLPNIDCTNGWPNGTVSQPITIIAQHERKALLQSDGSVAAFRLANCSYWNVEGLHGESMDLSSTNGGKQYQVFQIDNSNHINLRRILAAHNNRYFNDATIGFSYSTNSLIEESEAYYFHRHGINFYHSQNVTIRRCYVNSRGYADLPGCTSTGGTSPYCSRIPNR